MHDVKWCQSPHKPHCCYLQTLRCADFYAGCGGLSFIDKQTDKVHITTKWAVDFCDSMTLSFKANYPEAEVAHLLDWTVTGYLTATEALAMVVTNTCTSAEAVLLLLHAVLKTVLYTTCGLSWLNHC